jgi:trehalose 6-phosphate synthase
MWGNFPQTYSMVGIINAAVRLSAPWDSCIWRRARGAPMSRLVVVSNRVADPRKTAAGGLAVALAKVPEQTGGCGSAGAARSSTTAEVDELHMQQAGKVKLATIDLSQVGPRRFYLGYSNGVLWPVFHNRLDLADFDAGFIGGYRRVNQLFARKLMPLLQARRHHLDPRLPPDPAGRRVARHGLQAAHRLFPAHSAAAAADLAAIPQHDWLMRALFAYDLIGFQSAATCSTSSTTCERGAREAAGRRWPRLRAARCAAGAFPIGIDVDEFARSRMRQGRARHVRAHEGASIRAASCCWASTGSTTPRACRSACAPSASCWPTIPRTARSATLIQIASPSRETSAPTPTSCTSSKACAAPSTATSASSTGCRCATSTAPWRASAPAGPVPRGRVALVTPLRDGMNLVAKEYIAAQDPADPGVLVLSRFAGAAEQLKEALLVNPYDTRRHGRHGHQQALQMPLEERRERHQKLLSRIREQDIHWWRRCTSPSFSIVFAVKTVSPNHDGGDTSCAQPSSISIKVAGSSDVRKAWPGCSVTVSGSRSSVREDMGRTFWSCAVIV